MDATTVTIAGNVATDPTAYGLGTDTERVRFRVIANQRRFDRKSETWVDAGEYSVTVVCWNRIARGVISSVRCGDPVVVIGRITERKYEVEGTRRYTTEVNAGFVGHDLSKGTSNFRRFSRDGAAAEQQGQDSAVTSGVGNGLPIADPGPAEPSDGELDLLSATG